MRVNAKSARAELRIRPLVQGAAVVLDNNTGAILAVAGGFSYPLSQLNRATQSQRQPGSTLKPFTYLAALRKGIQPNTIVRDTPLTLPPIYNPGRSSSSNIMVDPADKDYWTPKNYSGGGGGVTTLRRALENSKNLVTANLLDSVIDYPPGRQPDPRLRTHPGSAGLQGMRALLPVRAGRAAGAAGRSGGVLRGDRDRRRAAIAACHRCGGTERPHGLSQQVGADLARLRRPGGVLISSSQCCRASSRAARRIRSSISRQHVGGKTGTSDNENDAWFIGFTNEVTVGVWVGYDNADGKRRTLGGGMTGAKVAIPIFEPIMQAVWANYAPRTALSGPSLVAGRQMAAVPINLHSGDPVDGRRRRRFHGISAKGLFRTGRRHAVSICDARGSLWRPRLCLWPGR